MRDEIPRRRLVEQLRALGVRPGDVLMVHTSFSKVAPVDGGPVALVESLAAAVGPDGGLVMPSMGDDDDHPFDPQRTPCVGHDGDTEEETVFLHPAGVDDQCDETRASIS